MNISPLHKSLVRRSFGKIAAQHRLATRLFYQRLSELDPTLKPLLNVSADEQGLKLLQQAAILINLLDNTDDLAHTAWALGARHLQPGADETEAAAREALLWTIERMMGTEFTPPLKAAWMELSAFVGQHALEGSREICGER